MNGKSTYKVIKFKDFNDKNVLMEKADLYRDYNESDGYFSFIEIICK